MSMGEKLEKQCLSRASRAGGDFIQHSPCPRAWQRLGPPPRTHPHFPVWGTDSLSSCCFSSCSVEPVLPGSFWEKAGLGTEAKDIQQQIV